VQSFYLCQKTLYLYVPLLLLFTAHQYDYVLYSCRQLVLAQKICVDILIIYNKISYYQSAGLLATNFSVGLFPISERTSYIARRAEEIYAHEKVPAVVCLPPLQGR